MIKYILGISACYHDSSAVLVKDGSVSSAVQEERFTRKKHDSSFPNHSISYCLSKENIGIDDISLIAVCDLPSEALGLEEKDIKRITGYSGEVVFYEHTHSHAAAAFYPSPFKESAILTMNSGAQKIASSTGVGKGNEISNIGMTFFPDSLGLFYSAFTHYCGFKPGSGEYKLMGLAAYGEAKYADIMKEKVVDLAGIGDIKLNHDYFEPSVRYLVPGDEFSELFKIKPREPEAPLTKEYADLAKSVQVIAEEVILHKARSLARDTHQVNLCMAGGMALNCAANGKLLREKIFENIWIQPASNDAGASLGAALLGWHAHFRKERKADGLHDKQKGSFLGPEFEQEKIKKFLDENKLEYEELREDELIKTTSDLLSEGKIVGWFQGRMEFGPRALGARSVLADPRSNNVNKFINTKVKFREPFRPFAPSVLEEKCAEYFDLLIKSPYMLFTAPVAVLKRTKRECPKDLSLEERPACSVVPAVTHVDFSARVQTVGYEDNHLFHELIKKFDEDHDCAVLVNTSFNVRGEPIVCTPADAYNCFKNTEMDVLVIGNFIIRK